MLVCERIIRGEFAWTVGGHAPCVIIFITTYFGIMSYLVWSCILTRLSDAIKVVTMDLMHIAKVRSLVVQFQNAV